MYLLSWSNPKGGTGKSTTALIVAEQLSNAGQKVVIIDNDPAQNLLHWASLRTAKDLPEEIVVKAKSDPDSFHELIGELEQDFDFAIVDMEGVKDLMASIVTMASDLVVIPMQASPMDARNAASQLSIVRLAERHLGRPVTYRFVFTRTNATIATKLYRSIREEMSTMPILDVNLVERAAYKHMHEDGLMLKELDGSIVSGLENAKKNAVELTNELLNTLRGVK